MRWLLAAPGISIVTLGAPAQASGEPSLSTGSNNIQQNSVAFAFAL